jgi:hypothetical protein
VRDLEQVFREAEGTYAELKAVSEGRVVRCEWATFSIYHPQPFYYERERIGRGRKLAGRPEKIKSGTHQYGFDGEGRIVVVRQYAGGDDLSYEEFFVHGDAVADGTMFLRGSAINVTRQRFDGGRIVSLETSATGGQSSEAFEYDDAGRISVILGTYEARPPTRQANHYADEMSYDEIGRLARVRRVYPVQKEYPGGREQIIYLRPRKGQGVRELAAVIEEKLVRLVPERLRAAGISERVYCVLLAYNSQSPELPPRVGVGVERQRRAWVAEYGKGAKHYVWNLPEFEWSGEEKELSLAGDAELGAACELFNQQLALKATCGPARKVLNDVARRLNDFVWAGALDVTDDFVVLAYDDEEIDFNRNLKTSVGPERVSLLKASGWL